MARIQFSSSTKFIAGIEGKGVAMVPGRSAREMTVPLAGAR
jgi:hypothetical protein